MKHQTGTFKTSDGWTIYYQSWVPDAPTAIVILAHGYAEHSGRYEHVSEALLQQGYAVYALDHRNHGRSDGEKGYVENISALVDDLNQFITQTKKAHPELPTVLLGHSMGGVISLHYAINHPKQIDLLVLSAPYLIDGGNVSPLLIRLSKIIATLFPRLPIKAIDSSTVSRDPAVVKDYDQDPLNSRNKVRARSGLELVSAGPLAFRRANEIQLPILIMHGDADSIASVDGSRKLNDLVTSKDKSLRIYNGLYHEIMNEPEKEQVLADIIQWLKTRIKTG